MRRCWLISFALLVVASVACDAIYYGTMRKFGVEKRDILVKRVRAARGAQEEAKEEFRSALDKFRSVLEVEGGTLEDKYNALNKELERSESRAEEVHDRIKAVRDVSSDLFREWEKELRQYSDITLRAQSEQELRETRRRADALIAAMARAEERIDPVLHPLRDRVLFLKHNLNAQAVGALTRELTTVSHNVDALVTDLERAIAEADIFIKARETESS
ncbi:MAG: DUF2959 family protein [Luteitalea sp.]|nr:DUF2959 family protein [Luteitalea sp.]